ncbi:MAG: hypothetical protein ACFUZC_07885 [Chthoniobacteraceae bacterium]
MQRSTLPLSDRRIQNGAALVIVLSFVVLLTVLVVAFFSQAITHRQVSNSSANQTKADLLAQTAMQVIIGDLKQEIVAGSTLENGGNSNYPNLYIPISNQTVVPLRNGVPTSAATPIPNLVSRSVRPGNTDGSTPYVSYPAVYTNPPSNRTADDTSNPANVSSTTSALNGRSISPARWNSHYLIPLLSSTSSDSTPVGSFAAPDWVLVTRAGPAVKTAADLSQLKNATPSNTNFVVGRYAYAIYNEGGLLDVNVAGFPFCATSGSAAPGIAAFDLARKGSLAFADLSQMTGISGAATLTTDQINNLVGWRNYASVQPHGAFSSYTFDTPTATGTNTASRFLTLFTSSSNASLSVNTTLSGSRTDQMFVGRQQLIKLQQALEFSKEALQYLGTFSRELNQPSWKPAATVGTPAGNTIDYAGQADTTGTNRNIPNVRVKAAFTRSDGTTAVVGEPLIKHRFALSKLAWVASTNTNADGTPGAFAAGPANGATAADVKKAFGLVWDTTNGYWVYTSPDGSGTTAATAIKTLDAVAALNREPDFFELLKAGILSGSLGKKGPQPCVGVGTSGGWAYGDTQTFDGNSDYQVLAIGANMIDQADSDNYPMTIHFGTSDDDKDGNSGIEVYGTEDIPYLMACAAMQHRLSSPTSGVFTTTENSYFSVSPTTTSGTVWNPSRPVRDPLRTV